MRARAKELVSEGEGDHHAAVRGLQALAAKAKATHVSWHFYKAERILQDLSVGCSDGSLAWMGII